MNCSMRQARVPGAGGIRRGVSTCSNIGMASTTGVGRARLGIVYSDMTRGLMATKGSGANGATYGINAGGGSTGFGLGFRFGLGSGARAGAMGRSAVARALERLPAVLWFDFIYIWLILFPVS